MNMLLISFLVSMGICVIATPLTIKLAKKFNLMDDPKVRIHPAAIHKIPIPRAGGVPIYIAIVITSLLFLQNTMQLFAILISGLIVVATGLFDDKFDLSPYLRFFINIFCAGLVVLSGVTIPFITNPLGGILQLDQIGVPFISSNLSMIIPNILAIVWIVWVMNMLNWSKGVDGQMPGIAAISAIIIGIAALRFETLDAGNVLAANLSFIVAGAALGFLFFNFYPAKIFPGYSATILGFMIGIVSILSSVKLATAILVMGVPMVDALITITRRLLAKKSPFWHDKGHLHHLLLAKGMSHRSIAVFYWSMSLLLGIIALNLSSIGKLFVIISVIVVVSGVILTLRYITKEPKNV